MARLIFLPPARNYIKKIRDTALKERFHMAADAIAENPELGESKTGDLAGVRSYNIYYKGVNYELAYTVVREGDETVVVIMAGSRENFYEALKKYWL